MSNPTPQTILAKLPRHLKHPLALAEALNITLPKTPDCLEHFETFLTLQAAAAAVKAQQQLVALIDSPSPTLSLRACLTILSLSSHGPIKPQPAAKARPFPARAHALLWLYQTLLPGPLPAREIRSRAHAAAISESTLLRAKMHLNIIPRRRANRWVWALPRSGPLADLLTPESSEKSPNYPPQSRDLLDPHPLPPRPIFR